MSSDAPKLPAWHIYIHLRSRCACSYCIAFHQIPEAERNLRENTDYIKHLWRQHGWVAGIEA